MAELVMDSAGAVASTGRAQVSEEPVSEETGKTALGYGQRQAWGVSTTRIDSASAVFPSQLGRMSAIERPLVL